MSSTDSRIEIGGASKKKVPIAVVKNKQTILGNKRQPTVLMAQLVFAFFFAFPFALLCQQIMTPAPSALYIVKPGK